MRLVTWNINSVRARLDLVRQLVDELTPDVLCLQETKVQDHQFPRADFNAMGYVHHAIKGQKNHHGVAILSRLPLRDITFRDWCGMGDARYVGARVDVGRKTGPMVHNFYVPAGGDEPNPDINDKFAHKLQFLHEMTGWATDLAENPRTGGQIVVGDLNIAPEDADVWNPKSLAKVISFTPQERAALKALQSAGQFVDVVRRDTSSVEKLYSWWSYRARDWSAADKGRRLDHIWLSPDIADRATNVHILRAARGWGKPSDHAPIIMDYS